VQCLSIKSGRTFLQVREGPNPTTPRNEQHSYHLHPTLNASSSGPGTRWRFLSAK
jgi:hypothetical protein